MSTTATTDPARLLRRAVETHDVFRAAQAAADGAAFLAARKQLGLSQRALAERLGVNWTYLSKVETGATAPGMPLIRQVLAMLEDAEK